MAPAAPEDSGGASGTEAEDVLPKAVGPAQEAFVFLPAGLSNVHKKRVSAARLLSRQNLQSPKSRWEAYSLRYHPLLWKPPPSPTTTPTTPGRWESLLTPETGFP